MVRRRDVHLVSSRPNRPLVLFLVANLFSLLVGNAFWDPSVPRSGHFILVQTAQWALFVFSAGAFWLMGNLVRDEIWLRRITFLFVALAGSLALLYVLPPSRSLVYETVTYAMHRAPFWLLLSALAGGQLLFNNDLSPGWRLFIVAALVAVLIYSFFIMREVVSHFVGVAAVAGVLAWLRWPRLRWLAVAVLLVTAVTGVLSTTIYTFAGGDAEWEQSGGSRLALSGRVVEVTMRNPITGLGPASYRNYANMKPLRYGKAFWTDVKISSHNNYVDLFAHSGLVGLGLFVWFAVEVTKLGLRLRDRFAEGFASGYVNGMLAAWAGALVVMLLLDWILPFVYNVGFLGFQASVLVWLFLGGLLSLEAMDTSQIGTGVDHAA
jgi:O-antigen ligase